MKAPGSSRSSLYNADIEKKGKDIKSLPPSYVHFLNILLKGEKKKKAKKGKRDICKLRFVIQLNIFLLSL